MIHKDRWCVRSTWLLLGWFILGCAAETPPQSGDPVQITPEMEKMKGEMLKSFNASKTGAPGKGHTANPAQK
jgi:hypothetical protein